MRKFYLTAFLAICLAGLASAQISLTGTPYSENFDVMTATGTTAPAGWSFIRYAGTGTGTPTLAASNGNTTSGGAYNVGTTGANDRALGTLASGSFMPAFGASFINNTGSAITSLTLEGFHEQWKSGSIATVNEVIVFEYSTDATSLSTGTWTAVTSLDLNEILTSTTTAAAVDGNAAGNRAALSGTISSLNIANGSGFWIRWRDLDNTGSDGMYAVDDLQLSYTLFTDNTAPTITTLFPPNGTLNHPSNLDIKMTFSEPVVRGTGIIKMFTSSGYAVNVDVSDPSYVLINNNMVTLNVSLFANDTYKVLVPAGTFKDAANNQFAGLDSANWKFATVWPDGAAPLLVSGVPAHNATGVPVSPSFQLTFNENILIGTGNILVKKSSDNSVAATIPAASVTISGTMASFNVTGLQPLTAYYLEIPNTLIKDNSSNPYAGISGPTGYAFTTGAITSYAFNFNACTGLSAPGSGFQQISVTGDSVWACTVFGYNSSNGVQINGYGGGGGLDNEDWLISPALDLTGFNIPILSFRERTKFAGPDLQVLVSTNYSGTGSPSAATWTTLATQLPAAGSDVWTLVDNINLNTYKTANTYIAFKYLSSPAAGAARTTLDDITLTSASTAPAATVTLGTKMLNFDYVASGNVSTSKTATFSVFNAGSDLTITAPASFQVSKDNAAFAATAVFTAAELSGQKTFYVRYAPTAANASHTGQITLTGTGITSASVIVSGNSHPHTGTLEVVNWNLEWFGSPSNGPSDDALQEANAKTIMDSLKADIYAIAEVVDTARLGSLARSLNGGYNYVVSLYASNATDPSSGSYAIGQKLSYIYKTSMVQNVTTRGLLKSSATASSNWSTGRVPFLMKADIVNGAATQTYNFILLHAKANTGDAADQLDSYNRRKAGVRELKDTLDAFFSNEKIIILGDFNDDLDSTIAPGVSPKLSSYDDLIKDSTDADSYKAITLPLSLAGVKSTGYDDIIDHVVISNEMLPAYLPGSARAIPEVADLVVNYTSTTSDHLPIMSRYLLPTLPPDITAPLLVSTNPLNNAIGISLSPTLQLTFSEKILAGTGNILVKKASDNSVVATINAATGLTIANTLASFNLAGLASATAYYVEVPATAFKDSAGNFFAGFTGAGTLKFTTADVIAPTLVSTTPVHNASGVSQTATLSMNFSEKIVAGTGNILVKKASDNSVAATIAVSAATVSNNQASFTPAGLLPGTLYYIEVPATAFKDTANNFYAGITGATTWAFTTQFATSLNPVTAAAAELVILGNPVRQSIAFRFMPVAGKVSYELIAADGRTALRTAQKRVMAATQRERLDISALAPGTYILRIINNGLVITQSFVKQ